VSRATIDGSNCSAEAKTTSARTRTKALVDEVGTSGVVKWFTQSPDILTLADSHEYAEFPWAMDRAGRGGVRSGIRNLLLFQLRLAPIR
jgi:hypothetical protein